MPPRRRRNNNNNSRRAHGGGGGGGGSGGGGGGGGGGGDDGGNDRDWRAEFLRFLRNPLVVCPLLSLLLFELMAWKVMPPNLERWQHMSKPHNIGQLDNDNFLPDDMDIDSTFFLFVVPTDGEDRTSEALRETHTEDMLGMYGVTDIESADGSPVFERPAERKGSPNGLFMWHSTEEGGRQRWNLGPPDFLGESGGVAFVYVGAGTTRGPLDSRDLAQLGIPDSKAKKMPPLDGRGWDIEWADGMLHPSSVRLFDVRTLTAVLKGGARVVSAPIDKRGTMGKFELMYDGPFHNARPRYLELGGSGLQLWWNAEMKSWCVGPGRKAEKKNLSLAHMESWQYCHLRSHDSALLPEWIKTPFMGISPKWRMPGARKAKAQMTTEGGLKVGRLLISYFGLPTSVRVLQLPRPPPSFWRWWCRVLLRLVAVLCVLFVSIKTLSQRQRAIAAQQAVPAAPAAPAARAAPAAPAEEAEVEGWVYRWERKEDPGWWTELEDYHELLRDRARNDGPEGHRDFICSITHDIMRHPTSVRVEGGPVVSTYEWNGIQESVAKGDMLDPLTRRTINDPQSDLLLNEQKQRAIRAWAEELANVWLAESLEDAAEADGGGGGGGGGGDDAAFSWADSDVHVFVDHSNIEHGPAGPAPLNVEAFVGFVEDGRTARECVVFGSRQTLHNSRTDWEGCGYQVHAHLPGPEQGVDEAQHARILRTAAGNFGSRRIIALATGDGNANGGQGNTNFPECVDRALRNGWHVEVIAWQHSLHRAYRDFVKQYPEHFRIRLLDDM
jgi:hypothetical protein